MFVADFSVCFPRCSALRAHTEVISGVFGFAREGDGPAALLLIDHLLGENTCYMLALLLINAVIDQ